MKKIFVVDTDKDFQTQVKSICPSDQVEVQIFSSSMEIFSLIGKEKPLLIFVDLEVPDVNDFVMYDLLKKTMDNSIPVVVTYSNQSEKDLQQYKKMKFQANSYLKKPIANDDINRLLQNHLELVREEDDDFSDESIDRLVRGEFLEVEIKDKDETKELLGDIKNEYDRDTALPGESGVETSEPPKQEEKKTSRADKELRNQVISLERQNEFLRSENKKLSKAIEQLKADIEKMNAESHQLKSDLKEQKATQLQEEFDRIQKKHEEEKDGFIQKIDTIKNYSQKLENENTKLTQTIKTIEKEKFELQMQLKGLTNQLTDKERELVARNHEFEKSLKDRSEDLVQEVEERLKLEFKRKEDQLAHEIEKLNEEKAKKDASRHNELENLKQLYSQLLNDNEELKKREESLNRTVSTLAEEKVSLSEKVMTLEENLSGQQEECDEKEKTHLAALENLNKEMEKVLHNLHFYKSRVNELTALLKQALALTQTENQE